MSRELSPSLEEAGARPTEVLGMGVQSAFHAPPSAMPRLARIFRDHEFFLEMITCQDRRADLGKMRMVYAFNRFGPTDRTLIYVDLQLGQKAPSIMSAFSAADWFEREVFDMYGVAIEGRKSFERLLLPEDADFHPLLRDFGRIEDAP